MQLPGNLKASINTMEKMLFCAASGLLQRSGSKEVQLDPNSSPVKQMRMFKDRDADGIPYVFIQAVLYLDEDAQILDNDRWAEIMPITDMAMPTKYTTGNNGG
jgi:hypothetical protein